MFYKRVLASMLVSILMIANTCTTVYADNNVKDTNITEEKIENTISSLPELNSQIDKLYEDIGNELGIDKVYIKELHTLAGGKAIYAEKKPNIYADMTVSNMDMPMQLKGANTVYRISKNIDCLDDKIDRTSGYYLPDAVYSVSYDVVALMTQRYYTNRGGMQIYFESLNDKSKKNIAFYEAVMLYTGTDKDIVDNFYTAYEKILYDKEANENVVEEMSNGTLRIKDKFTDILSDIGIKDKETLKNIAILMSFDSDLAINDDVENLKDTFVVPYKLNYTSRENMMVAAASLCGKVRYVWGGGHSGASYIDGINPVWSKWNELYEKTEGGHGCIKPSGSWCPIHGDVVDEYHGGSVYSLDEYLVIRAEQFDISELQNDKYKEMLSKVNYTNGINVHTLDGLDCSGFASWLYNQITDRYEINSTATRFTQQYGLESVEFGSEPLPGDIFAWTEHIVVIVGKVRDNSRAYVTIEQTPNVLRYGVVYYEDASRDDINLAKQIASEANLLIGGIDATVENPHCYCMNKCGIFTETVNAETGEIVLEDDSRITDAALNKAWDLSGEDSNSGQNQEDTETETDDTSDNYDIVTIWHPLGESCDCDVDNHPEIQGYTDFTVDSYDDGYNINYMIPKKDYDGTSENSKSIETKTVTKQYCEIGRFKDKFIDEDTLIGTDNKTIKDMNAQEIIQHTLSKLPISYVSGYNLYDGELFDKSVVSSDLGVDK